jgi:hypothetical protein
VILKFSDVEATSSLRFGAALEKHLDEEGVEYDVMGQAEREDEATAEAAVDLNRVDENEDDSPRTIVRETAIVAKSDIVVRGGICKMRVVTRV